MSSPGPSIQLALYAGTTALSPVPSFLAEALQQVQATYSDAAPGVFQLTFHADRNLAFQSDYSLLSSSLLRPGTRIAATVSLNGSMQVLLDGFITTQELSHTTSFGASTLSVNAQDVSVLMDLDEVSDQYPALGDPTIVALVLAKYAVFGIVPEVIPPPTLFLSDPLYQVPQQNATDRAYIQQLAQPYGYVFFVSPGPVLGANTAYWGPPPRIGVPQKALSVNVGPFSNVESISFTHDALSASLVYGWLQDAEIDDVVPVVTATGLRLPPLAAQPALLSDLPMVRTAQFTDGRPITVEALVESQAYTDMSTDNVVVGQGQLDVLRYGAILQAPGVVGVRGVGATYDGLYYVQSVTHQVSRSSYKQQFTLKREGVMTTTTSVVV